MPTDVTGTVPNPVMQLLLGIIFNGCQGQCNITIEKSCSCFKLLHVLLWQCSSFDQFSIINWTKFFLFSDLFGLIDIKLLSLQLIMLCFSHLSQWLTCIVCNGQLLNLIYIHACVFSPYYIYNWVFTLGFNLQWPIVTIWMAYLAASKIPSKLMSFV